jgi:hypothetical protein
MNSLRVPVAILVVIVIALGAWYVLSRPSAHSEPPQTTSVATTTVTTTATTQPAETTPPTLNLSAVAANIMGSWQSTDDFNYTVNVDANNKWTDSYRGSDASSSVSETGTYTLFTSANPDKSFTGVLVPGVVYLKVAEGKTVTYYSVLKAAGDELQLSYLDRGNTLSFVRPKGL